MMHNIGIDWTVLDSAYLSDCSTEEEISSWKVFFQQLGVLEYPTLVKTTVSLHKSDLVSYLNW